MGLILLIVVIAPLLGVVPRWQYSRNWGYGPSGVLEWCGSRGGPFAPRIPPSWLLAQGSGAPSGWLTPFPNRNDTAIRTMFTFDSDVAALRGHQKLLSEDAIPRHDSRRVSAFA